MCYGYYTGETSFEVETEADSNDVTEHSRDNKPRPYVCTVCDKRFAEKGTLSEHKQRHAGDMSYSCTQCEKCFSCQSYLRRHMNGHTSKYKCSECGKCFRDGEVLTRHSRVHSGEKPFECTVCSKRFKRSGHLVVHNRVHSGEKPYNCHVCDKAFSRSSSLNTHMRVHTGEKPYKCSLCSRLFSRLHHLQLHEQYAHSKRKQYQCPYCGIYVKTNGSLKTHVRRHTGAKPYPCKLCSEHFRTHSLLKTHLLKSHNEGTWLTCYICQKKFGYKGNLKMHIRRHKGVKPMLAMIVQSVSVQQWKCDFITWCTPMLNTFAVVFVVKILKVNKTLEFTLGDVLEGWTWIDF